MKRYGLMITMFFISFLIFGYENVYAVESENLTEETEEGEDYEIISSVDEPVESNFTSKDYYVEGEDKQNYLVEGGNENAINLLATKQSAAGGTLTENTNIEGEEYDMALPTEEDFDNKDPLELRQFITFETKSGKEFHIIIDHGKDSDNVRMLTEVSEQDLLNLIEAQADIEIELIETKSDEASEEVIAEVDTEDIPKAVEMVDPEAGETTELPVDMSLIIIIAFAVVSGIAGWYFKIFKTKRTAAFEDEVDEADYLDDDEEYLEEDYE